jgi:anti-sigma regulatory factor (Ser/Thr protein kinase)
MPKSAVGKTPPLGVGERADLGHNGFAMTESMTETVDRDGLQLVVPADASLLASARSRLASWLGRIGIAHDDRFAIVLACSEAIAMGMERVGPGGAIAFDATFAAGALNARVRDFTPWTKSVRNPDRVRRLLLIGRLTDSFDVEYTDAGGQITLSWQTQEPSIAGRTATAAGEDARAAV